MRKILAVLLVFTLVATLTGCGGGSDMQDGTYRAEYGSFDDYGWKDFVELTITDGEITNVIADCVNEAGDFKSEDEEYAATMTEYGSPITPDAFYPLLEESLMNTQNPGDIDMVANATDSSTATKLLASELISKNVKDGDSEVLVVDRP